MIGQRFNKWLVLEFDSKTKNYNSKYKCICDCGKEGIVKDSNLRTGKSTQCKSCATRINGRKGLDAQSKNHLYMIGCGEYVKIGSTDNLADRLKNLEVSNPYPLHVLYEGINEGYMESTYHEIFSEYKTNGEWFLIPTKNELI